MPRIFDNIEKSLLPALQNTLQTSERADFCVGYFNLRGWRHLAEYVDGWSGGDGNCCRLLVGMHVNPTDELRQALRQQQEGDEEAIDNQSAIRAKRRVAEEFRLQLTYGVPTNQDEAALRQLAAQIRAKKLIVKVYLRHPLHAKLYLLHRQDANNPVTGFLGSSNLTVAGLARQGELNVDVLEHDACNKLVDWFEDRWTDRWCMDISKELADIIDESWAGERLIPPYHVYLKIAYHLAQEARAGLSEFSIPKIFGNQLFDFQIAAVKIAAHHLNKRGGVLIGDVVGLGKSMMATALAKVFEDDHQTETLILCPKNLVPMWEDYAYRYRLQAKVLSLSRVITELPEKTRRYRVVLVDESHNLRNKEGKRYKVIRDYIERNDSLCILLSATPYNKTYLDLSSQLSLFLSEDADIGIRPEKLISALGGEHEFVRRHQCAVRSLAAFEKSEDTDDWRDLMRLYMVRRTRGFIMQHYAKTDERGKYLLFADGTKSYFPKRVPKNLTFAINDADPTDPYARFYSGTVVDTVNALALPRYGLGNYIANKPKSPPTPHQANIIDGLSRAGTRLMGFCRTNLFKRLESAGPAFLLSIERHILRNFIVSHAIENGLDIPLGTQGAELLDTRLHDEDPDDSMPGEVDGGKFVDLVVSDLNDRKAVIAFRKELKQFTTGSRPHHCLVERIEITAPSPLLEQGILLIDTPGLGDTERFRVALTEQIVKDVDAVLFLTKSGPAFDQSEKDFLLSLLRRGTVKQLVFVVTQVDQTYEQHVNAAKSDDEDPEPIQMRIERERRRLRAELDSTLTALGQGSEDSPALERYREQLGEIELVFTSAINHRKANGGEEVHFPLHPADPGGMLDMQEKLMQILSSESRLAHVARALRSGAASEIEQMLRVIEARRAAVQSVKDKEVAEQKLGEFRRLFGEAGDAFSRTVSADAELLKRSVDGGVKLAEARIDAIVMSADKVLGDFESDDAGRHWRTRRSGTWGYMHGLQTKVANSIFPRVAGLLGEQQAEFSNFVEKFDAHLAGLAERSARISEQVDVGTEIRVDVAARLRDFLTRSLEALQGLIEAEEAKIIQLLEDFVTDDVSERISSARGAVSGVWGTGTTIGQTREVKAFYAQVRAILATALEGHLRAKHREHGEILIGRASELPDKALSEVKAELERIGKDITAAAEAASSGQKVAFEELAGNLASALQKASEKIAVLFGDEPEGVGELAPLPTVPDVPPTTTSPDVPPTTATPELPAPAPSPVAEPVPITVTGATSAPDWDQIQAAASLVFQQFRLQPEESNWGWGKIFGAKHVRGATHALLIDPYLDLPHQRRNLQEVVQWLCDTGPVKSIRIITGHRDDLETAEGDQQLRLIAEQLAGQGVDLNWDRDRNEHDRFLMLDNGIVFKLGKGLDIYRATQGLGVNNPIYRRIKSRTTIDVMGPRPVDATGRG